MSTAPFVIITPAHNEAALIERTIESMLAQAVRPLRWIIVNDGSTDGTADIVRRYAARNAHVQLLDMPRGGPRHFGNKVRAFNAGLQEARALAYRYVGNLDADISLSPDYFYQVLRAFERDPQLGVAGGMVSTLIDGRFISQAVAPDSVAGAVQLFRRSCFEDIGGYLALPQGGIDSAAEIMARMKGWKVQTLPDLRAFEYRRTGSAARALPVGARFKEGQLLQSLGYNFPFLCLRCVFRLMDHPWIISSIAILLGYLQRRWSGAPLVLPPEAVSYLRAEQQSKLKNSLRNIYVRHLRNL